MPLDSLKKKAMPPADLNPEHELPAAPQDKILEVGHKNTYGAVIFAVVVVLLLLILALVALALR